jgi:hypothetical protein
MIYAQRGDANEVIPLVQNIERIGGSDSSLAPYVQRARAVLRASQTRRAPSAPGASGAAAAPVGVAWPQQGMFAPAPINNAFSADLSVWPNRVSHANSDWLIEHHDAIRQIQPRILAINFANNVSREVLQQRLSSLIDCLNESSRYHGYKDRAAAPFMQYQIAKLVDLADDHKFKCGSDDNCSKFPVRASDYSFRYPALFEDQFARYYQWPDPENRGHLMTLGDLVNAGYIHEVWIVAHGSQRGGAYESVELKQAYDEQLRPIPGSFVQAGNGGDPEQPVIGRSLRILFVNVDRGPGCAMESLGHSFERMADGGSIPYLVPYFKDFAGFNLDSKYGMPFNSLYGRNGSELSYPGPTSIAFQFGGRQYRFDNYISVGGNVHFTINGRHDYDLDNPQPVSTTIEHYGLRDGANGGDATTLFTPAVYAGYRQLANDCMGPWLIYWRQNWPGYRTRALDDDGRPMKNWCPFLFY